MMSSRRLLGLVDELAQLEVFDLALAGGEPLLHPAVFEVLEATVGRGLQVGLLTNGVLLVASARRRLLDIVSGRRNFILQVSLDSANPEINDLTRGAGRLVVNHILALTKEPIEVQVATVVTRRNYRTAHEIIGVLYPHVRRFHFLNVQRTVSSLARPELLLQDEDAEEFWQRLAAYSEQFGPDLFLPSLRIMQRGIGIGDPAEIALRSADATFDCRSCSTGLTHVNIDADFNVLGCDIAKDFTFMGNVRDRSFADVWTSREASLVRDSPYPPCYNICGSDSRPLRDSLRDDLLSSFHWPEEIRLHHLKREPTVARS